MKPRLESISSVARIVAATLSLALVAGAPALAAPDPADGPPTEEKDEALPELDLGDGGGADAAEDDDSLVAQQARIAKQYAELEKKLFNLAARMPKGKEKQAARLRNAFRQSRDEDVVDVMARAMKLLTETGEDAGVQQKTVLESLERVLAALEADPGEEPKHDVKKLEKLLKNVKQLKDEQQKHIEASEKAEAAEAEADALGEQIAKLKKLLEAQKEAIKETNAGELDKAGQKQAPLAQQAAALAKQVGKGAGQPGAGKPGEGKPGEGKPGKAAQAALQKAQKAMEEAKKKLDEKQQDPALERARAARDELVKAKKLLEQRKAEVLRLAARERRKAEQERTRRETERLKKDMQGGKSGGGKPKPGEGKPGGPPPGGGASKPKKPGARNIEKAEEAMKKAGDDLANRHGKKGAAKKKQEEAKKELDKAEEKLEEALMQARKREQEAILRALGQRFVVMLEKQKAVTKSTEGLQKDWKEKPSRGQRREARVLAQKEGELRDDAGKALEIVREEGSTAILPTVIGELVHDLARAEKHLQLASKSEKAVNSFVVILQKDIERSLQELIEVIKKEIDSRKGGGGGGKGGGGGGNNENGAPLLPATAELKVLRSQQVRVNDMTKRFDLDQATEGQLKPEQKQAVEHIAEKQGRVAEFARDLHERLNKER